jgi:hypothetical protein
MALSYIGIGIAKGGAASAAVVSNASTLAGDLLVLLVNLGGATNITSITGGSNPVWTQFGVRQSTGDSLVNLEVWTAVAAAADIGATFTVNFGAAIQFTVGLESWRSTIATPSLANLQGVTSSTGGIASITAPTWNGANGIAFAGGDTFAATPSCTVTGGNWVERADQVNGTLVASDIANDVASSGIGNAGCIFTWTQTCAQRCAITFNVAEISGAPLFFGAD